ncbi:MAG: ribonuclease HII [Desulfobulbaceae bacterium]|nr:MAG: ribonuclease HII [Desulfobulbaceae bacterium]
MKLFETTVSDFTDNFYHEKLLKKRGFSYICGTDEVGRGPLAGPVVAAAVILPADCTTELFTDSKKTTEAQRRQILDYLNSIDAPSGIGILSPSEVDRHNIHQASLLAMKQSIEKLAAAFRLPDFILVDGKYSVPLSIPQESLIKGDSRSASIGAASILAKVTRDTIMAKLHDKYPIYNFLANKGYPTQEHRAALKRHGPCPEHRRSFKGVLSDEKESTP